MSSYKNEHVVKGHFRGGRWIPEHVRVRRVKGVQPKNKKKRSVKNVSQPETVVDFVTIGVTTEMQKQITHGVEVWNQTIADLGMPVSRIRESDYITHLVKLGLESDVKK